MDPNEMFFAMYFASLSAWRLHPGYQREGAVPPPSLEELAHVAGAMLAIHRSYFLEDS